MDPLVEIKESLDTATKAVEECRLGAPNPETYSAVVALLDVCALIAKQLGVEGARE